MGHGLYPLWLFSDGVSIFANEEEREIALAVVKGIQRRIRGRSDARMAPRHDERLGARASDSWDA